MASQELINIIIKATDEASATAKKVDDNLRRIGSTISSKLSRIPGFDALKGKFTSFTNTLRGKVGPAIDGVRNKLTKLSNGGKGLASSLSFLKGAASMTVGMIGYDLVNSLMETTKASLNARSAIQSFGSRLNMSGSEVATFQESLDTLQQTYKKIDIDVVGQQAMDMAYRLGLPKTALTDLTETTAVFSDAFARNGRSAEDATLAMADAMDGEFKRLKEIGISQEDLMNNGWNGDINDKTSLIKGLNGALKEQHYDVLAKNIDTLDDAWNVLTISLSNLIEAVLVPLTPIIVEIITYFTDMVNAVKPFVKVLQDAWEALPDWMKDTGWAIALGLALALIGFYIQTTLVPALAEATLAAIDFAIAMMANPLTWVVLALAAVALAIYEVGKAFGWWTDVQSMLAAIWDGVNRLWQAFINHPDVQAAIGVLVEVWNALAGAIGWVWNALMDFFNLSTGGNFDIVKALIDGIGAAWDAIKAPIMFVIDLVRNVITVFDAFRTGQIDLPNFIIQIGTMLINAYMNIFRTVIQLVIKFGSQMLSYAIRAGRNFLNGIANQIRQVPNKVYTLLLAAVAYIKSAIQAWINAAVNKAKGIVDGVGRVLSGTKNAVANALNNVKDAIVKPFKDAYDQAKRVWDDIVSMATNTPRVAAGGVDLAAGGTDIISSTNGPIEVNINEKLTLDLINVPAHIDENTLIQMLSDKKVLKAFTNNKDFQEYDLQVKNEISKRLGRARGV